MSEGEHDGGRRVNIPYSLYCRSSSSYYRTPERFATSGTAASFRGPGPCSHAASDALSICIDFPTGFAAVGVCIVFLFCTPSVVSCQ